MEKAIKILLILLVIAGCLFCLSGCGKKKEETIDSSSIVGRWKYKNNSKSIYIFKKDGTGIYELENNRNEFTYKAKGKKLSIKYNGSEDSFDTTYSIKDDVLTIVDAKGKDQLYKRMD